MKVLKRLSAAILEVQSRFILSLVYIVILPIFALIFKSKEKVSQTGWRKWKRKSDDLKDLQNQF